VLRAIEFEALARPNTTRLSCDRSEHRARASTAKN
jgi:hypothetical protein